MQRSQRFIQITQQKPRRKAQLTMASGYTMMNPICLVENKKNQLTANPKALEILDKISQPVVVVAIVGLYRTGKSYLMNRLAGQKHGFTLGSTVRSETKGIWMWCLPHPSKLDHTLVLLDTEGLGDVEKGDPKNDSWIFALAVLLSSMFVYNSMGAINHQALEQLHYVTELTQLIRTKSSPSLGGNPQVEKSNMPKLCIKNFFPRQKCFVFDWPTNDKISLRHMEEVSENELDLNFQEQSKIFCDYIFTHSKAKTIREEIIVTGNGLGILAKAYVDAINSGSVPCLENAVTTLAQHENSAAVQKAADHYREQMAERVRFPTDTLQELLDLHAAYEREAIAIFMEHSFKDDEQLFQGKLMETIRRRKEDFLQQNEHASGKYCQAQLKQLTEPLLKSISKGTFSVSRGYDLYLEAIDKVEQSYDLVPRKGIKANEVFQNFLLSQTATKECILQADRALTAGEKDLAAECAKKLEAEKERELLRQKLNEKQEEMKAQEKSFEENIAQLKNKLERDYKNRLREQEEILEKKLKLHTELCTTAYKEETKKMMNKISQLEEEIKNSKKNWCHQLKDICIEAGRVLLAGDPSMAASVLNMNTLLSKLTKFW
ncbi:guanylate-binding protein 7-like isoform X2 [Phyllostomus hastatus]|uniref:guanylate-binding protein 7-like isoform X2 n=1 Tax=Phyllostomus hastatus TaxID=9423 RepID=UPI001E67F025|nr:guanylate-binding protein 7-like isoform X2 [Phyllostomus hastatus]